ncbi:MAG: hypothetical protein Q8Q18_01230 [bacterium]|nr:hypothetical protein [bacterium]
MNCHTSSCAIHIDHACELHKHRQSKNDAYRYCSKRLDYPRNILWIITTLQELLA